MLLELSDINIKDVITKCYFYKQKKVTSFKPIISQISPLDSLLCENSDKYCLFTDSFQKENKLWINLFQYNNDGISCMPRSTTLPCWWCRMTFSSHPLGVPLKYHCEQNMTDLMKSRLVAVFKKQNLPTSELNFFEVEGNFCSFCCIESYIKENAKLYSRYKKSSTLNCLMYQKCKGELLSIPCSPSWKMRKEYGGHLTDEKYRACIGILYFLDTVNLKRPLLYSCHEYIEEKKVKKM
jgi:hypothetical protein